MIDRPKYDSPQMIEWRKNRLKLIKYHYGKNYFREKQILELAAAWGTIGSTFARWGAVVTCTDYSKENLTVINNRYPNITTQWMNLNDEWSITTSYDFIIHMGVFYHQPPAHATSTLRQACRYCNEMIFETAVADESGESPRKGLSYIDPLPAPPKEDLWETDIQIPSERCLPSVGYINKIFDEERMIYKRISASGDNRLLWLCKKMGNAQ